MTRPKVFRDPIHSNIELNRDSPPEKLVLRLLDSLEVQRLRHVRQLGLANLVYHGVEHSRFIHSLGVTSIAKLMHSVAAREANDILDEGTFAVVLAAAVLHDVGHPPFSHAVEKQLAVKHEDLSIAVIRGATEVNRILRDYGQDDFVDRVADHIAGTSDAPTTQIVSSQLDADRSDYVLRDGYYAGIPNSRFDLNRIVQLLYIDEKGLFFDVRAQTAVEGYFIARYHLYLQLYYHKTVRAAEAMLRSLLGRAKRIRADGTRLGQVSDAVSRLFSGEASEVAVRLTDSDLWAAFHVWSDSHADKPLQDLSMRLRKRELFKAIEIPVDQTYEFMQQYLPSVKEAAAKKGFDPEWYVLVDTAKDTPYKIADVATGKAITSSIRLRREDGSFGSLEIISGLVKQLQDEAYKKIRVCFPAEIRDDALEIIPPSMRT